jgi:hypothetical protein
LEQLSNLLNKGEIREARTAFYNKEEIKKLTSETLFIQDGLMI